jgi:hypothetical protein
MPATGIETSANRTQEATDLEARYAGWHVWLSGQQKVCLATRTGKLPSRNDATWARTLIADSWHELEAQLAEQAAND